MGSIKKRYRENVNLYEIKTIIEAKAMKIVNMNSLNKIVGTGYQQDDKFYYKVEVYDGVIYKIYVKYYEMMDLVYYQVFSSRNTGGPDHYYIYEEGYQYGD